MEVIVKAVGPRVGVIELAWVRYVVHVAIVVVLFAPSRGTQLVRTPRWRAQVIRSGFLMGVTISNWVAVQYLPLAEVAAIVQLSPILVTVIAVLVLHERVGRRQWFALAIGFAAVLLMVQPGGALATPLVLLPMTTAICYASYQVATRSLGATEHPSTTMLYTALLGFVVLAPLVPAVWLQPTPEDLGLMLLLGCFAALSQGLFVLEFRFAPASTLAPLAYTQLVWATVTGFLFFGDVPAPTTILAMAVIVVAGLLVIDAGRGSPRPVPMADDGPGA
jgi:drug/metabolite transporter (DMT)-like permease